jgi:spermidine synthase
VSNQLGRHLLVEFYLCNRDRLDDAKFLKDQCIAAAEAMGATVVGAHAHRFQPIGVSVVVILSESHLALHTWPERATASMDVLVCSPAVNPHKVKRFLAESLIAMDTAEMEICRGTLRQQQAPRWLHANPTSNR